MNPHNPDQSTHLYQTGLATAPTWATRMARRDLLNYLQLFPDHPQAQHWATQLGQR